MALCDHVSTHRASAKWGDHVRFNSEYAGFDEQASRWLLDQGLVNLGTDAPSPDNPADTRYPNHLVHGERGVPHTEIVANIERIPARRLLRDDPAAALRGADRVSRSGPGVVDR